MISFRICVLVALCAVPMTQVASRDRAADRPVRATLYSQALIHALNRELSADGISYLWLDANSGSMLASHWQNSDTGIGLGSLVKPFAALAYAETHNFVYPVFSCRGRASGCWQRRPHGMLDITSAISMSCNSYFQKLAMEVDPAQLLSVAQTFGLPPPQNNLTPSSLVGLGDKWKISPLQMARAYAELYRRRDQQGVPELLAGMSRSARRGTGAAVGRELNSSEMFVKTGTAPCTHGQHDAIDGFVVVLLPSEDAPTVLLVRVHGVAGAEAAETAGRALRHGG
jgi:cell division protein FtsI/penicillin-binding protein 2